MEFCDTADWKSALRNVCGKTFCQGKPSFGEVYKRARRCPRVLSSSAVIWILVSAPPDGPAFSCTNKMFMEESGSASLISFVSGCLFRSRPYHVLPHT